MMKNRPWTTSIDRWCLTWNEPAVLQNQNVTLVVIGQATVANYVSTVDLIDLMRSLQFHAISFLSSAFLNSVQQEIPLSMLKNSTTSSEFLSSHVLIFNG
jgi:hypothetical protein